MKNKNQLSEQIDDQLKDDKSEFLKVLNNFQNYIQKEYFDKDQDEHFKKRGLLMIAVDNVMNANLQQDSQTHISFMGAGNNLLSITELILTTEPFSQAVQTICLDEAIKRMSEDK